MERLTKYVVWADTERRTGETTYTWWAIRTFVREGAERANTRVREGALYRSERTVVYA